jgi:hypothetical protein
MAGFGCGGSAINRIFAQVYPLEITQSYILMGIDAETVAENGVFSSNTCTNSVCGWKSKRLP